MLRMILMSVFAQETYSKYDDLIDIGADQKTKELVGHKMLEDRWDNMYQKMQVSDRLFMVKTHEPPEDDSKAIYIVRDGRSAIISYKHYLHDFLGKNYSWDILIAGFVNFASWGRHLDVWDPVSRPHTLLITYENLLRKPAEEIEKISSFTGLKATGDWKNNFQHFHKINPRFFRQGSASEGIDTLKGNNLDLFWLFNGDWMEILGYGKVDQRSIANHRIIRNTTHIMYAKLKALKAEKDALKSEKAIELAIPLTNFSNNLRLLVELSGK